MGKRYEPELKQNVDINEKVHIYIKPFDHIKMNLIICFNVVILKKKKKGSSLLHLQFMEKLP